MKEETRTSRDNATKTMRKIQQKERGQQQIIDKQQTQLNEAETQINNEEETKDKPNDECTATCCGKGNKHK